MKLRQIVQILLLHVGEEIWPNDAGVVDYGADGELPGDVGGGCFGRARIGKIDLDRVQRLGATNPATRRASDTTS